jgi:hypothetical protein
MAMAISFVMVSPPRLRPLAGIVGLGLAVGVGLSAVSSGWHFPSDVAGGFLLATGWGLVIAAFLQWAGARWPERHWRGRFASSLRTVTERLEAVGLVATLAAAVGFLLVAGLAVLARGPDIAQYASDHTSVLLVGPGIAALAVVLLGGMTVALRRRT